MNSFSSRPLIIACLAALPVACACSTGKGPGAALAPAAASLSPSSEVARLEDTPITLGELDAEIAGQLRELDEQRYQLRRQGLDQMINHRLMQAAAQKRKVEEQAFLKEELDNKVKPVDDEQVKRFFEERAAQLPPGAKFEDYRDRIATYLARQGKAERAKELFAELRKNSRVSITLAPPPQPKVEIAADGPSRGPKDAKVTIVEFSDFECPYCRDGRDIMEKVVGKYGDKVRLVFRNFPLSAHRQARKAAEAGLCAEAQGKFWPLHDTMFAHADQLSIAELKAAAGKLGVEQARFDKCLDNAETAAQVEKDLADGEKAGINGTPAFFINGRMLSGVRKVDEFSQVIDEELAAAK